MLQSNCIHRVLSEHTVIERTAFTTFKCAGQWSEAHSTLLATITTITPWDSLCPVNLDLNTNYTLNSNSPSSLSEEPWQPLFTLSHIQQILSYSRYVTQVGLFDRCLVSTISLALSPQGSSMLTGASPRVRMRPPSRLDSACTVVPRLSLLQHPSSDDEQPLSYHS